MKLKGVRWVDVSARKEVQCRQAPGVPQRKNALEGQEGMREKEIGVGLNPYGSDSQLHITFIIQTLVLPIYCLQASSRPMKNNGLNTLTDYCRI